MQLTQMQLAKALLVPLNTLRMWDSGLRKAPDWILSAAGALAVERRHQRELLPIHALAADLGIHRSTLEAAIRSGRLPAQFSTRSVFGRPIRVVARGDAERFRLIAYGRRKVPAVCDPLPQIPADYPDQLVLLRRRLGLTQAGLAQQSGAANKAVIYQRETRKRIPTPVFWKRVQELDVSHLNNQARATETRGRQDH
jgi:DNA-binding XRE family transcriptional regulator